MAPSSERSALAPLLLAALLLAGCAEAPDAPGGDAPEAPGTGALPSVANVSCSHCYEPTLAALPEGLLVDDWSRGWTLVARDGTVNGLEPPKPDLGPNTFTGEPFLAVSEGEAIYAVLAHSGNGVANDVPDGRPLHEISVHHGFPNATEVARLLPGQAFGVSTAVSDRPWVVAQGPRAFVSWALPNFGALEGAWSEDGGKTWSETRLVQRTMALGLPSPRFALSDEGRLLMPDIMGTTTLGAGVELPARLAVRWSDDGGLTWTDGDGPGLLALHAPRGESFWVGTAWGNATGFVLAWATDAGTLVLSTSQDGGASWSAPRVVHQMDAAGKHPWAEPYGACVTLSAWSHDVAAFRGAYHLVVVRGEETVLAQTVADVGVPQTDFAQHVILDGHAVLVWLQDGAHRLAHVPLDGLGCGAQE